MSIFFDALLNQQEGWRDIPLVKRTGSGWSGFALIVSPHPNANLSDDLDIEEVGNEITVSLDYCHTHMDWPPNSGRVGELWGDPLVMIDAILNEKIVAASGWIDGKLRVGSLCEINSSFDLIVPNLELLRVRSWRGTFDEDRILARNS